MPWWKGKAAAIRALTERYFAESVDFDNALARLAAVIYRAALAKATQINEPDEEGNLAGKIAEKTSEDLLQVLYEIVVRGPGNSCRWRRIRRPGLR